MEAGVGRGQRGGQRCASCMLGKAALRFSHLPPSLSLSPAFISTTPLPLSFPSLPPLDHVLPPRNTWRAQLVHVAPPPSPTRLLLSPRF